MIMVSTAPQYWPRLILAFLLRHSSFTGLARDSTGHNRSENRENLRVYPDHADQSRGIDRGYRQRTKNTDDSDRAAEYKQVEETCSHAAGIRLQGFSALTARGQLAACRWSIDKTRTYRFGDTGGWGYQSWRGIRLSGCGFSACELKDIEWTWDSCFGANVLVDGTAGEELYTAYLQAGQSSEPIPLSGIAAKADRRSL